MRMTAKMRSRTSEREIGKKQRQRKRSLMKCTKKSEGIGSLYWENFFQQKL